jgi:hemolysin III
LDKSTTPPAKFYSPFEERLNIVSHGSGFVLSIFAGIILLYYASKESNIWNVILFGIYSLSLIMLYAASTIYHSSTDPKKRARLRILDHAAIYVLIAGTYTPFTLITLKGDLGLTLFIAVWVFAFVGVTLKLFFTGKFNIISTLMYVAMGWLIIFAYKPLLENLAPKGVFWLILGGAFYTIGALLFSIKRLPLNHAIFHVFVLLGSFSHYMAVFFYVLPYAGS